MNYLRKNVLEKRYIASIVAASVALVVQAVRKQKEKEGVKSFKDLTVVRETVAKTKLSAEKTKETCKVAVKVAKETYEDFKVDIQHINKGGSMDKLPSKYKQPRVYGEVKPLILEDLNIEEDKDLNKKLNEMNNSITQNN